MPPLPLPGPRRGAAGLRRGGVALALTLLLSGLLVALTGAPASACSCVRADVEKSAENADVVLSGTVVKTDRERVEPGRPNRDKLTLTVSVDRVYKGTITRDTVEVSASANTGACGLGALPDDQRYFVFAFARGSDLSTNACTGTNRATSDYTEEVRAALGEGTPVDRSSPTSAPPERTSVDDGEPPDFGRTAAPGGALAIVGLLGLLLVRRRARRD